MASRTCSALCSTMRQRRLSKPCGHVQLVAALRRRQRIDFPVTRKKRALRDAVGVTPDGRAEERRLPEVVGQVATTEQHFARRTGSHRVLSMSSRDSF